MDIPYGLGIPLRKIEIMLESNPLKSRILVRTFPYPVLRLRPTLRQEHASGQEADRRDAGERQEDDRRDKEGDCQSINLSVYHSLSPSSWNTREPGMSERHLRLAAPTPVAR